jgi:hypothetical protein
MIDNINEIKNNSENNYNKIQTTEPNSNLASEKNLISVNRTPYEFKEEPIQLVISSDGILETTTEAINILTALKNEKLCILSFNGPLSTGKSTLANRIINKESQGFKIGEKTKGIWLWGKPIPLDNGVKLLILDCQGLEKSDDKTSCNLFLLNVLLSTSIIYNTKGELTENIINDFGYFTNLSEKVNINSENDNKSNNLEDIEEYFPQLFFINDVLSEEDMKKLIEKNPIYENLSKLFDDISYFNTENTKEIMEKIRFDKYYKTIKNNVIDGDSLFGLLQNYIDFLNNGERPLIKAALDNVLLSKAKNESDYIIDEFKNYFNKKLEYPMSITDIYKIYFESLKKYTFKFCKKVDKILTPNETAEYLKKLFADMEKELDTSLETNKDYYDEWFNLEYKELEEVLNKINLESIDKNKLFILSFTSTLQTCLSKFLNMPNNEFCKNLLTVLSKIFNELVIEKINKYGEKISDIYENYSKECNTNIENLNNEIKKLNEQIDNSQKLIIDKNKEKSESNRSFLELETKLDKLNRDIKTKEKEYENNINIEIQKYQKMESYYGAQIKEKEEMISKLEYKIEQLNQDILGTNKESIMKENELNRENIKLQSELEQLKKQDSKGGDVVYDEQNLNLQTLFKSIQNTFMDFKESVDKLDKENENVFKTKHIDNSTKEIEGKLNTCVTDIKSFCEKQIKTMVENYEVEIKKIKDEYNEINFQLSKKNVDINEQTKLKEVCETKLKESVKQIGELKEISKSKDSLIATQNEALKMYEDKINDYRKMKEDLELSLAKNIYNFKMKEDEFDSLLMVIEGIVSRKKEKYEHNLHKLSPDIQNTLQSLVKQYKFFK